MFRFEEPAYLYLLLLLPFLAAFYLYSNYLRRKAIRKFGDPILMAQLMPNVSKYRPDVKYRMVFAAIGLFSVLLARPQFGSKLETVKRQGVEVMIALDISNSMLAQDVQPSRLEKAKRLVAQLVDKMENDKVGMIVFAGDAFTQLPITNDYISAKMAFETAVNELEDTRLTAPFNGYVSEVYIEKFQDVKAAQPILSLIDIHQLRIEIYVPQEIAYATRSLDNVQIRFDALPDKIYRAKIIEISKGTTRNNLSYLLTAMLPNENGELLAGMSGKAMLSMPQTEGATGVCIPQEALCHRPSIGNYVWVITSTAQAERRKVTIDKLLPEGKAKISTGLNEGETIATSGLRFLSDGTKVTILTKQKNS